MPKKPVKTKLDVADIPEVTEEPAVKLEHGEFIPTRLQRKCKSLILSKIINAPEILETITKEEAIKYSGIKELNQWWQNELFVDWLQNNSTQLSRAHYLLSRHLDNLEEIIEDPECTYSAGVRLSAGKQLQEMMAQARNEKSRRLTEEEIERIAEKRIEAAEKEVKILEGKVE